jgi:uncharacterized protein (TIGR02646 family)
MIRVNRDRVPSPSSLDVDGVAECKSAIAFYSDSANREAPFEFRAYRAKDVASALTALFHGKCAYCESKCAAVTWAHIEHFRPKGAVLVKEADGQQRKSSLGYYWLAAEWDNLLLSCPKCNCLGTHEYPDGSMHVTGKQDKFPLISEAKRARAPGEEITLEAGQRLLLHPCRDQPERHLEYLPTGIVRERLGSRKGRTSIDVFGLRRSELNQERLKLLLQLARQMRGILKEIQRLQRDGSDAQTLNDLQCLLEELRETRHDNAPYAGMARQFISAFEASIRDGTVSAFVHRLLTEVESSLHPPLTSRRPKSLKGGASGGLDLTWQAIQDAVSDGKSQAWVASG